MMHNNGDYFFGNAYALVARLVRLLYCCSGMVNQVPKKKIKENQCY